MKISIVGNSYVLKYFKLIDIFKLELGVNLKGPVNSMEERSYKDGRYRSSAPPETRIKDGFIVKYYENFDRLIHIYGYIGQDLQTSPIKFYTDIQLLNNELYIFNGDDIYELPFDDEIKHGTRKFLAGVLENIEKQQIVAKSKLKSLNIEGINGITNMPENIERPDISLPHEQYVQAMVKRRNKLSNTNNPYIQELIEKRADKSNLDLDDYVHEIAEKQRNNKKHN